jgi:hypothetical protein
LARLGMPVQFTPMCLQQTRFGQDALALRKSKNGLAQSGRLNRTAK